MDYNVLAEQAVAAVGLGALVMLVVQIIKMTGVLPDGKAGWLASVLNVIVMTVLMVAGVVFEVDLDSGTSQAVLTTLATIAEALLAILTAVGSFQTVRKAQMVK